jgi:hypothetical protein
VPGGVLALDDKGEVIGAVGISGDASDKDEIRRHHRRPPGGLKSDPAEPTPNWKEAGL